MTIEQTEKIDFVSKEKDTGIIKLTISDHLDWDYEDKHLLLLQKKINTYLHFIESGQLVSLYPDAKGREVLIGVVCKYPPDEKGIDFLNQVTNTIEGAGMKFRYQILDAKMT